MRRAAAMLLGLLAAAPAHAAGWPRFAPYVDFAGSPPPNLRALGARAGIVHPTLGFVVAQDGTRCVPSWGGFASYPASGAHPYRRAQVGDAVVSFGGQAGTELASACSTPAALARAYASVLRAYGVHRADFDIEGAALADAATNERRTRAIAALQRADRRLRVAYTLPVLPGGLAADGRSAVRAALRAGVRLSIVNVMAMDYGGDAAPHPAGRMGAFAISAARATARQLRLPLRRIGVTPMIGVNDVASEVFGLADARTLTAWARTHGLGLLSMWEAGRDRPCRRPTTSTQIDCSSVAQAPFAFARIFERVG